MERMRARNEGGDGESKDKIINGNKGGGLIRESTNQQRAPEQVA